MQLILIRHALPARQVSTSGPADPGLTEVGHAQAQHLAEYFSSEPLQAIYSSPMLRAIETAKPLAAAQGLELLYEDGVAEFDRNASTYVPIEELRAANDPRWREMAQEDPADAAEFRSTVVASIEGIIAKHVEDKVAVVCHAGVIGTYMAHVLGINMTGRSFFAPNYTSINRVMASRKGGRSVFTLNETSHLRGTGLPTGLYD
jgi:2,3-bisphosphoglycerate-dependent phosphoglycerate mutase